MLTYLQAIVIAVVQGVTELFPVSSLGHSVLVPAWIGGEWETLVTQSSQAHSESSFYLAFIVALHVATALALLWFFRADWVRIVTRVRPQRPAQCASGVSARRSRRATRLADRPRNDPGRNHRPRPRARLPHRLREAGRGERPALHQRADPARRRARPPSLREEHAPPGRHGHASAAAERPRGASGPRSARELAEARASDVRISGIPYLDGVIIGSFQILALLAGISRSGVTMVGGLWRGLSHEDAARFAFLLATPVILAAGALKVPCLFGSAGEHIHGQVLVGFVITGVVAYFSVRYLVRYFQTRTLTPFAIYCLVVGAISFVRFAAF